MRAGGLPHFLCLLLVLFRFGWGSAGAGSFFGCFFFFVFFDFVRFIWDYISFVSILLGCT